MKWILPLALVLAACSSPSKSSNSAPSSSASVEVVALKYAVANDVARLLGELPALSPKTRVLADPRTNSLVVQADAADMPRIRELIAKLDVQVK